MDSTQFRTSRFESPNIKNSLLEAKGVEQSQLDFIGLKYAFDPDQRLKMSSWIELADAVDCIELESGSELQEKGRCTDHIYFLVDGYAREYSKHQNGNEVSRAFYQAKAVIGALSSYQNSIVNKSSIQMLTQGKLYRIPCDRFEQLTSRCDDLEYWYRLIMSRACLQLQNRLSSLLAKDHSQRLIEFVAQSPELVQAVPTQHLSTYLDIPSVIINIVKKHVSRQLSTSMNSNLMMTA